MRVDVRGGNGVYRRRRAVGALAFFLSHLSGKRRYDGLNVRIARRRAGGDTRRSPPAHRRACLFKGGLSVAVLPPPQLRTPMFARQSRRFTTQNRGLFERRKSWRFAREGRFDVRQPVITTFRPKNDNCRLFCTRGETPRAHPHTLRRA